MDFSTISTRGLVLLGCGKMGSAMLAGWLRGGLAPGAVHVIDPHPSDWLQSTGVAVNGPLPEAPAVVLIAVKPQMMAAALPQLQAMGGGKTLFVTVAAGTTIATYEAILGAAMKTNDQRQDYVRATLARNGKGQLVATAFPKQDSSMQRVFREADCLIIRPPHAPAAKAGELADVLLLDF